MKRLEKIFIYILTGVLAFAPFSSIESMESENYAIEKDSINFSGTDASESENYILSDSAGEIATGEIEQSCHSLSFDGTNDYASMPQEGILNGETAATIAAWFKTSDTSGAIIAQYSMSGSYGYKFNIDDGKIKACFGTTDDPCYHTGYFDVAYDTNVNDGTWHHAVVTYDGANAILYVDGVERDNNPETGTISYYRTYGNIIGSMGYIFSGILYIQGNGYLNGQVDDVLIYERALSATEAQDLYAGNDVDSTGLKARWGFNEGSGTTVYDASGNGKDGVLVGDSTFSDSYPASACNAYLISAGYRELDENYIAISAPSDITMSPGIGGISGGVGDGNATWTVTTDNSAGYQVSVRSLADPALASGSYNFADYTPAVVGADFDWLVDSSDSEFGYTVEGSDVTSRFLDDGSDCGTGSGNTADKCWYGFSTSDSAIVNSSSPNHPLGSDVTIKFRAESGSSHFQEEGTYTATIVVTAVAL